MPYIGNTAADRFVASKAASVFSGDGSTTAFTLSYGVGSDEDILVSVDGVIQEPSVAYSVSGTTLTFTAAPSSNAGNNIFVYYLFRTVGTVSHPSSNALEATSGTFSGDLTVDTNTLIVDSSTNKVGIGATPDSNRDLHIKRTGANASIKIEETSATNYAQFIELKDSTTSWFIANRYAATGSGASGFGIGTTNSGDMLQIDTNGHVIMPYQPAFSAKVTSQQSNIATSSQVTVLFATELYDQNSDYNNSTYTFTAPVTGKYQLNVLILLNNLDSVPGYYQTQLRTSNRIYYHTHDPRGYSQDLTYHNIDVSILADMDAGDTAYVTMYQAGGTQQSDIDAESYFTGVLIC